jgi:hypothetical protein
MPLRASSNTFDRGRTNYRRDRQSTLTERDRILIVCEDSVAGCQYFKDFRSDLRLSNLDVHICGEECGSAPTSVYEYAVQEYNRDKKENGDDNAYDKVYCVFDRDQHADFARAMDAIKRAGVPFQAIPSYPCFELWILMHFEASSAPLPKCDDAIKKIKQHLSGYKKNEGKFKKIYPIIKEQTSDAIKNSKQVLKEVQQVQAENPSTLIHVIAEHLIQQSQL